VDGTNAGTAMIPADAFAAFFTKSRLFNLFVIVAGF
jgi:hypothetical protein